MNLRRMKLRPRSNLKLRRKLRLRSNLKLRRSKLKFRKRMKVIAEAIVKALKEATAETTAIVLAETTV